MSSTLLKDSVSLSPGFRSTRESVIPSLRQLYEQRYILGGLVSRDIRARYVGSVFGVFWSVLHPLTQFFLYWFIFSAILRVRPAGLYQSVSFAPWFIAGYLPWMFFTEVVMRSPDSLLEQANLIKKTVFPSELISLSHAVSATLGHGITLCLLGLFSFIFWTLPRGAAVLVLPTFFFLALFSIGLGWILASLNVFFRDIGQFLRVLIQFLFYLTPIAYPVEMVPVRFIPFLKLNPLYHFVEGYRCFLFGQELPSAQSLGIGVGVSLFIFVLGYSIFQKLKTGFADVL